jgi:DNA helicase-2/ATP-dependent DNA helicase PcrA
MFDEVLVDEMQDTNPLQFSILKFFADNSVRLFCVGDPAQSIYKFRGAEFKHIYDFQKKLQDSEVLNLSLNYRSSQEILDFANWLLDNSFYDYSNKLESVKGSSGKKVYVADFRNKYDEAKWIINYIVNEKNHSGRNYQDFMILVRSAFSAKAIEAELIQNEIPYKFVGGLSFAKTAHIRDVLSLVRAASAQFDELAWMRYLQLWQGIGPAKSGKIIDMILSSTSGKSALEILQGFFGTLHPIVKAYQSCLENIDNVSLCIYKAVEHLVPVLEERYEKWNYRKNDLELLCSVAGNYDTLHHLIEAFTLEPVTQSQLRQEDDESEVTLITVHSSKGTEADVCFIAQANQGIYPHVKSCGDLSSEEEERRILYVAVTRAKEELFITRTEEEFSFYYGNPALGEDYFLSNMPESMIEFHEPECYDDMPAYDEFDNQF